MRSFLSRAFVAVGILFIGASSIFAVCNATPSCPSDSTLDFFYLLHDGGESSYLELAAKINSSEGLVRDHLTSHGIDFSEIALKKAIVDQHILNIFEHFSYELDCELSSSDDLYDARFNYPDVRIVEKEKIAVFVTITLAGKCAERVKPIVNRFRNRLAKQALDHKFALSFKSNI